MEKSLVRKQMLAVRSDYQHVWLQESSKNICEYLSKWPIFKQASCVMGYLAYENEVNIDDLLTAALAQGKKVAVPLIMPNKKENIIKAIEFKGFDNIVVGEYGIRTVDKMGDLLEPASIDLVLVPGVAFTEQGERLGMGKGYYDNFLPQAVKAKKIGITLSMQLAKSLPTEEHDIKVDFLVTEKGIIECKSE